MDNKRTRNWGFVAYPESLPEDWQERLERVGAKIAISPLHDADKNTDGTLKKAHYHVIICFTGVKSYEQVKDITDELGQTRPEPIRDITGSVRYLAHLDNPQKAQYDVKGITTLCGFDLGKYLEGASNKVSSLRILLKMVKENHYTEISDLVDTVLEADEIENVSSDELLAEIKSSAYLLGQYITSSRYRKPQQQNTVSGGYTVMNVSRETGEVTEM